MMRAAAVILCLAVVYPAAAADPAGGTFARALQAEADLRIDEARDLLRQALPMHPVSPSTRHGFYS